MLTRLEVDGFKNLLNFSVDFGPFNCIAGPNGVGKSNIFDAIRFLSLLADNPIRDAALGVRGSPLAATRDLLWTDGEGRANSFRIAAEMIVQPKVFDDIGQQVEAASTYLRYEVEIGYCDSSQANGNAALFLLSETLYDYTKEEAKERLRFPHSKEFFEAIVLNKKGAQTHFIETVSNDGQREIIIHPNGSGTTAPKIVSAAKTPRTMIAASGMWAEATILATRREMQSWKLLAMEPAAIRTADLLQAEPYLTTSGGHLHATLYRLATTTRRGESVAEEVYATVKSHLAELLPVKEVGVNVDPLRQLLTVEVEQHLGAGRIPARSLSDGTLRFLTLAVLSEDPNFRGLVCIEEPENGIHPGKLEALVELLKEMVVDPTFEPDEEEGNYRRQVIIATHSPYLVQLLSQDDLLFTVESTRKGPSGKATNVLRCWPLKGTWRHHKDSHAVPLASILAYLKTPVNAQIRWSGLSS